MSTKRALIIVDVQNDFCKGGNLEVRNADEVVPVINALRKGVKWDLVLLTQDFHPQNHISFASNNPGAKPFTMQIVKTGDNQMMWPDHCVQGSQGAEFHKDLLRDEKDVVVKKGLNPLVDSYSGFCDNSKAEKTEMEDVLRKNSIEELYVTGVAYEYCAGYTALDGAGVGFKTHFVSDASRPVQDTEVEKMNRRMRDAGITIVASPELL